jgi:hypothetical protein
LAPKIPEDGVTKCSTAFPSPLRKRGNEETKREKKAQKKKKKKTGERVQRESVFSCQEAMGQKTTEAKDKNVQERKQTISIIDPLHFPIESVAT